jgi:hypothetical protein
MVIKPYNLGCLAQRSYLVGDREAGEAVWIDPRRDVDECIQEAQEMGAFGLLKKQSADCTTELAGASLPGPRRSFPWSVAGNTLGLGSDRQLDAIVVGLGSNDCKTVFAARQGEVARNLEVLLQRLGRYLSEHGKTVPRIVVLSAPPVDESKIDATKYAGAAQRVCRNNEAFRKVTAAQGVYFLDTYTHLNRGYEHKTRDGIHLNERTQFELATLFLELVTKE